MTSCAAAVLLALVGAGCASGMPRMARPGGAPAEHRRDSYECERDARFAYPPYSFGGGFVGGYMTARAQIGMWTECIEARGYVREKE